MQYHECIQIKQYILYFGKAQHVGQHLWERETELTFHEMGKREVSVCDKSKSESVLQMDNLAVKLHSSSTKWESKVPHIIGFSTESYSLQHAQMEDEELFLKLTLPMLAAFFCFYFKYPSIWGLLIFNSILMFCHILCLVKYFLREIQRDTEYIFPIL